MTHAWNIAAVKGAKNRRVVAALVLAGHQGACAADVAAATGLSTADALDAILWLKSGGLVETCNTGSGTLVDPARQVLFRVSLPPLTGCQP